ncbi:MAG TPA: hypothetical protein VKX39_03910 [Bryobacteraceae bacterium]|jgi:hypothetical protein|nr:hypothetical protein [Bryobacteraceae bacterium]
MPCYKIHRLKDHLRAAFRAAPHVSGTAEVKPRDYTAGGEVEASSPYAAYFALRESGSPLQVGDILEAADGPRICKFVGFEEARWLAAETPGAASNFAETAARQAGPVALE